MVFCCVVDICIIGNTYATAGLHAKAKALRNKMDRLGIKKIPGMSWTADRQGSMHAFYANDSTHPQIAAINQKWQELQQLINYKPDLSWVYQNESDTKKETRLCRHSEKLAICFALITLPEGQPVYVVNNLRMCGDCHAATTLISKLVHRKIIVRDSKVFHTFEDGFCSCNGVY